MFHQVRVSPQDTNSLGVSQAPQKYMMQVHLFGATSSPSCTCFALQRTTEDHKDEFDKETVKTVDKNFYIDDCLKSTSNVEKPKRLATQLWEILAKGGFCLTKWEVIVAK